MREVEKKFLCKKEKWCGADPLQSLWRLKEYRKSELCFKRIKWKNACALCSASALQHIFFSSFRKKVTLVPHKTLGCIPSLYTSDHGRRELLKKKIKFCSCCFFACASCARAHARWYFQCAYYMTSLKVV